LRISHVAGLKGVFAKITIKRHVPRLSPDFELALYKDVKAIKIRWRLPITIGTFDPTWIS
jgi:hypothetical protein